jgi:short-subunit dehydrogenase
MSPKHVLITGTTSGIGRGLLAHYVRSGVRVTSVNRRVDSELAGCYPDVQFKCVDVRDGKTVEKLISELVNLRQLPDLFILNAGINGLDNDATLDLETFRRVLDTNLFGALHFAASLTSIRTELSKTAIVAISSMANYAANPYCLGYSVSKMALSKSFEVLAAMYQKTNLKFKWVVLGPVGTGITATSDKFPKIMAYVKDLFSISLTQSVQAISSFAESDRKYLIYPLRAFFLFRLMRWMQYLIPSFYRCQKPASGILNRPGETVAHTEG